MEGSEVTGMSALRTQFVQGQPGLNQEQGCGDNSVDKALAVQARGLQFQTQNPLKKITVLLEEADILIPGADGHLT